MNDTFRVINNECLWCADCDRFLSAKEPLITGLFCRKRHSKRIHNIFRVIHNGCLWSAHCDCRNGWRRCTERRTLQVSVRKRATNYRTLLQKETYKDQTSYASSPPCRRAVQRALTLTDSSCCDIWICVYVYVYLYVCIYIQIYVYI